MSKLSGKIALISGGTSGIGAATAKLFQSEGATVVVTGSSEASAAAARADMPGVEVLVSNAADIAATQSLVEAPASPRWRRSSGSMKPSSTASSTSMLRALSS